MQISLKNQNRRPLHMFGRTPEQQQKTVDNRERDIQGLEFILKGGTLADWAKKTGVSEAHTITLLSKMADLLHMQAVKVDPTLVRPRGYAAMARRADIWLDLFHAHKHKLQKPA